MGTLKTPPVARVMLSGRGPTSCHYWYFSDLPPPNRAYRFPSTRLSNFQELLMSRVETHYAYPSLFDRQSYLAPVLSALLPHVPDVTLGIWVL
jgi:hypothetical protein